MRRSTRVIRAGLPIVSPRLRERKLASVLAALGVVSSLVVGVAILAPSAQAFPPSLIPGAGVMFGSRVAPRGSETERDAIQRVEGQIGRQFAIDHQYYSWSDPIPTEHERWDARTGRIPFLNWHSSTASGNVISWGSIASGAQDPWIIGRADAFIAFGSPVYLTFHHEPEDNVGRFGSPSEYVAAFRHIVDVFRAQGVTNVAFVWTMTALSFVHGTAADFYPGDDVVDIVAADGYNWAPGQSGAQWKSFAGVFQSANDFAIAHGKPFFVGEYGVQEDPSQPGRKAQWLLDMLATVKSWPQLKGLMYFDSNKGYPWVTDSSDSAMAAYATVAQDPYMNGSGVLPSPSPPPPPPSTTTITNGLNAGPQGAPITARRGSRGSTSFDAVITENGSTLTYDRQHARGRFAAKHVLFPRGDAFYEWDGERTLWFGRVFVWLKNLPPSGLRLIRAESSGSLDCALDLEPGGRLRFVDAQNRTVVTTRAQVKRRRWVRIEVKVNHAKGTVVIKLFDRANASKPTQIVRARRASIGASADQFQFGRSGHEPFAFKFWTDDPGLSSDHYLGP